MDESEALSDVLDSIRVKSTIAAMDDRPRFKRIYGTDIDVSPSLSLSLSLYKKKFALSYISYMSTPNASFTMISVGYI